MALQTWTGITVQQRSFYNLVLLKRLLPALVMFGEGRKESIGRRQGKTIEWRYMDSFPRALTPLTEGAPPTEMAMTWTKTTTTIAQYGAWTKMSDLLVHQGIDPVWTEASGALGEQAGQTLHTVLINALAAGTNVRLAGAVAARINIAAANVLNAAEIRRARRILAGGNPPTVPGGNARGFRNGYHALIHPYTMEYLTADPMITSVATQGAGGISKEGGVDLLDGTVMKYGGFVFKESTDAPVFTGLGAGGIDVFGSLFYGPDWFGEVDLQAAPVGTASEDSNKFSGVRIMGVPVDQETKDDPLGQFGTLGWKAWYCAVILQQQRGCRVEHSAI